MEKIVFNIDDLMQELSTKRLIFHSEADFQFELAWLIKEKHPNAEIRMERPYQGDTNSSCPKKMEVDILVILEDKRIALELKYITKKSQLFSNDETYNLSSHGAQLQRRYDFYRDVNRLECLKSTNDIDFGFAVFLTNDFSYLKNSTGSSANFNFLDNHTIVQGVYDWVDIWEGNSIQKKKSTQNRLEPISIRNRYQCSWKDYSQNYRFKYLALIV